MPTSELEVISPRQDCNRSERIAREWAVTFAELYCIALVDRGPRFVDLWVSALADLEPNVLDAACRRAMEVCKFFPSPAEIRAQIDKANASGLQLEAAEAWDRWLKHVTSYYHPDLGWDRRAPKLPAVVEHAARAAGGAFWVSTCPESELQWARVRFMDAYALAQQTCQVEHLLSRGEAKKILSRLTTEALPERALSPPPTVRQASLPRPNTDDGIGAAFEEARRVVNAPRSMPLLSPEEIDRRKHEQRARLERHLQEHPELCGKLSPAEGCEPVLAPNLAEVSS